MKKRRFPDLATITARVACAVTLAAILGPSSAASQTTRTIVLRGRSQTLRIYGPSAGDPVVVSSGDGGWIHLGPHVAETLAAKGFYVVGFDVKAYLESFTSGKATLRVEDEPCDYQALAALASQATGRKPVLIGVSEGAGLSVLAATNPRTQTAIAGVIGLGLPDVNELAWRWRDSLIYLTHGVPDEPTFRTAAVVDKVAPIPLAAIHATNDEFVPLTEVQTLLARAKSPKRLWIVKASNHRFSDNEAEFDRRLLEAIAWVRQNATR